MYCSNCGKEIDDDSKFCQFCGYSLEENVNININEEKQYSNKSVSKGANETQVKMLVIFVEVIAFIANNFIKIIIIITIIVMVISYMIDVGFEKDADELYKKTIKSVITQYKKTTHWKQKIRQLGVTIENSEPEIIDIQYLPYKKDCSNGEGTDVKLYNACAYYGITATDNMDYFKMNYKKEEISFCEYIDKKSNTKKVKFWMGYK